MHGLINRAIEMFVRDTYGRKSWGGVAQRVNLGFTEFESMLDYPGAVTEAVLADITDMLGKAREEVLEDIGTYLVSHPNAEALRRLLRFSGADFVEFLHSLEDLPARAKLAVPDLILPQIELRDHNLQLFSITVRDRSNGPLAFGHVLIGLLRALADDYGALVLLDHKGGRGHTEIIEVNLLETAFAEGRAFSMGTVRS